MQTVEDTQSITDSNVEAPNGRGPIKYPRGYVGARKRLERALKQGATIKSLLGRHHGAGHRIHNGQSVRKSSLSIVVKALNRWDKQSGPAARKAVREDAAKMSKPQSVAALVTAEMALHIIESFVVLDPETQRRVLLMLHATKKEGPASR